MYAGDKKHMYLDASIGVSLSELYFYYNQNVQYNVTPQDGELIAIEMAVEKFGRNIEVRTDSGLF